MGQKKVGSHSLDYCNSLTSSRT